MTSIKKLARMTKDTTVISTRLTSLILSVVYGVAASIVKTSMAKQIVIKRGVKVSQHIRIR